MRSWLILFGALLLGTGVSGSAQACSQCLCGMPFPADVLGGVIPKQVTFGLDEHYLSKVNALDEGPGEEHEREHRLAGIILWRPTSRLALLARMPYNFKQITTRPDGASQSVERSRGLGDAELLALVGLARVSGSHAPTFGLVLGMAAPTGSNDALDKEGLRLDSHLQPGTGAWSGTGGVHLTAIGSGGVWDASLLDRINGRSPHGYRYGSSILYNAGITTREWKGVQLIGQLNGRSATRDRLEAGSMGKNTGGTVLYAAPGVRWQGGIGVSLEGAVQVPVLQSLYGDQTEHTTARLTLSWTR
jgi:hypothetical protein